MERIAFNMCAYQSSIFWSEFRPKTNLKVTILKFRYSNNRLLDEAELGIKSYTDRGGCLVPRRLSFDENVRAKEGGKNTLPMVPCSSSPVTRVSRSAKRKSKRLRRRLSRWPEKRQPTFLQWLRAGKPVGTSRNVGCFSGSLRSS